MPQTVEDANKAVTTLSDQVKNSFNSTITQVSSAINGFVRTMPTSVGDSINNVNKFSNILGTLGLSSKTSASQALNQLGSLGTYTKFKDNFSPPSKVEELRPQDAKPRNIFDGILTYPSDLTDMCLKFEFKEYERKAPIGNISKIGGIHIYLPIPSNLTEQFSMNYADKQLGLAGFIEKNLPQLNNPNAEELGRSLGKSVRDIGSQSATPQGLFYGARTVAGLSDSVGSAVDKATGAVLNPFQAMIFQGVNLRSHSFTYKFSPNNTTDNDRLRKIIFEFKRRMHPLDAGLIYQFPQICDIKFGLKEGDPYFFTTCFLESMNLNYAPGGTPAFFADNEFGYGTPVEIEMTLNFKEIRPITQNDFVEPAFSPPPSRKA